MSTYTEDHLVEQPAIQLMQHELGWDVVNCYDEWSGGVSHQGRDGKREGVEILNVGFWILNGRGRLPKAPRLNLFHPALSLAEVNREIDKHRRPGSEVLFALEPAPRCNRLKIKGFLFEWKTSA